MSRCGIARAILVAVVIASLASSRAALAEVALGASFGYTHLRYSLDSSPHPTANAVGITGAEEWKQPGMRVGYIAPDGRWDLNADVGLVRRSGNFGFTGTVFELLPQLQVNGRGRGGLSPFVNGGVGIEYEDAFISANDKPNATRPLVGGGIGLRKSVSDGHGLVRIELRYDHLFESKKTTSFGTTTFPATDLFSVKLGFDLLVMKAK